MNKTVPFTSPVVQRSKMLLRRLFGLLRTVKTELLKLDILNSITFSPLGVNENTVIVINYLIDGGRKL